MNYFDEVAEQFIKAEQKRKIDFLVGIDRILAKIDNIESEKECQETIKRPFLPTMGYNEYLEAELAIQNDVL